MCSLLARAYQVFAQSDRIRRSLLVDPKTDVRLTRLSLLYMTSFPGSGKTHACRLLAETVDELKSGDMETARRLLSSPSLAPDADGRAAGETPPAKSPPLAFLSDDIL